MTLVIAEVGVNHNGDIKLAKELIEAAKYAGADIVKFQTFKAELVVKENTPVAPYQKKNNLQIKNQYELIKNLELSYEAFYELKEHADNLQIEFLSTAFDITSIRFLNDLNLKRYKIPSGEIDNYPYLREIAKTGKPIILSTGMSNLGEIEFALNTLIKYGAVKENITVLHCVSQYPAPIQHANLNAMSTISDAFKVDIGYSDHTEGFIVSVYAAVLGAKIIEKHITLDRKMKGPDHLASIEPKEFKEMCSLIREVESIKGNGIKKLAICEIENLSVVRRSIVAKENINIGDEFTDNNLTAKRPANGISPRYWQDLIGKKSHKKYQIGEKIDW